MTPPKITAFHHVSLVSADLDRTREFYTKVLGLSLLPLPDQSLEGKIIWFDLGETQAVHVLKGTPSPDSVAHFALRIQELKPWKDHLSALGIPLDEPDVQLQGKERLFIKDPDGNPIEISQ